MLPVTLQPTGILYIKSKVGGLVCRTNRHEAHRCNKKSQMRSCLEVLLFLRTSFSTPPTPSPRRYVVVSFRGLPLQQQLCKQDKARARQRKQSELGNWENIQFKLYNFPMSGHAEIE